MKKINAFLLTLVMLLTLLLAACGQSDVGGNADYSVKVTDAQGIPYTSGVIVKFMKNGAQVAMQAVDANGVATKQLEKGDYTVELVFTSNVECYYDPAEAVLSAKKTSIQLQLSNVVSEQTTAIYIGETEYAAHTVTVGSTYAPVKAGERNYFLFTPEQEGTYKFSVNNSNLLLGYYGMPHFVQSMNVAQMENNAFSISVSEGNLGGGAYVIGIDGIEADTGCIITIERIGAPEYNIADEPWTEYRTTAVLSPYTLTIPAGKSLIFMDVTASTAKHTFVFNEADGYYHLDTLTGPVIHVQFSKGAPYVALQSVIQGDGAMGGAPIRKYFFDENGEFIKKEDYTDILESYFENMDPTLGVYPLTDDLIYIIQNGCNGWWDSKSPDFIFEDSNPALAWMFACCWIG